MKKTGKILSTLFALSMVAVPFAPGVFAVGDEPATCCPSFEKLQYHYKGMGTRWVEAHHSGKPAARFFWYCGPNSGWSKGAQAYISESGELLRTPTGAQQPVLILLDNDAARTAMINYYTQKGLTEQVKILNDHPQENLFMITYDDLQELSKTITLFTEFERSDVDIYKNDTWAMGIVCQSRLLKTSWTADAIDVSPGKYPTLQCAAQRDLRPGSRSLGEAWYAWECMQAYYMAD